MEDVTIVITGRDRFSTTSTCINNVLKNTPTPFKLIAILGGCPAVIEKNLKEKYGNQIEFIFKPQFLNTAEARNMALSVSKTRLTAFIDTDVFVRPHWLEELVKCQLETGASLVTPLVLEQGGIIHTAGNDLYITSNRGKNYGFMELRFSKHKYLKKANLKRREIDFAEIHCHLLVTETARSLQIYDEHLREHHEMDSGLVLQKAGHMMMFEPNAKVFLYYTAKLIHLEDVAFYLWKWDLAAMHEGFKYFEEKWNIDLNIKNGFVRHLKNVIHRRVGKFTRRFPSKLSIKMDWHLHRFAKRINKLLSL